MLARFLVSVWLTLLPALAIAQSPLAGISLDNPSAVGAPTDADYLVGTANAGLSAEIVVPAAGVTWLLTPNPTNFAAFQTGETGTGAPVLATAPDLVAPIDIGVPTAALLTASASAGGYVSNSNQNMIAGEYTGASGAGGGAFWNVYQNDGAALASGDRLGGVIAGGSSSASALRTSAAIEFYAAAAWSDGTSYPSRTCLYTTAVSATSRTERGCFESTGLLSFGGATSSFPALKRSSAKLIARLADDSANTNIEVLAEAYDATNWNSDVDVPQKDAVRDIIEIQRANYFRATMSGTDTLTDNVATVLEFNSETIDVGSHYDPTTNFEWCPAHTGGVQIEVTIFNVAGTFVAGNTIIGNIQKGTTGAEAAAFTGPLHISPGTAGDGGMSWSVIDTATSTDCYRVAVTADTSAGSPTISSASYWSGRAF